MGLISFSFHPACAIDPLSAADRNYTQLLDLRPTDVLQTKSDGAFLPMKRFEDHCVTFIAYLGQVIWL